MLPVFQSNIQVVHISRGNRDKHLLVQNTVCLGLLKLSASFSQHDTTATSSLCLAKHGHRPPDHPAWCGAYSNAIKPPPRENRSCRGLSLGADTKETHLKRSRAQPEEVRGLFTEQQSLIGCTLPQGASTQITASK